MSPNQNSMTSKYILAILTLFITIQLPSATAQWSLGGESGFQLNNAKVGGLTFVANRFTKAIITSYARVNATYDINDQFGVRTGIGYSKKGFQVAAGWNVNIFDFPIGIGAKFVTKANYVEVPLEGLYSLQKGKTTYLFTAGTNIGYATSASLISKASFIIDIKVNESPIDLNQNIYNRWDLSGTAGIGIVKETNNGKLVWQARYVRSLTNFLNNPIADVRIKPFSYQLSVGYHVPIGKKRARA